MLHSTGLHTHNVNAYHIFCFRTALSRPLSLSLALIEPIQFHEYSYCCAWPYFGLMKGQQMEFVFRKPHIARKAEYDVSFAICHCYYCDM